MEKIQHKLQKKINKYADKQREIDLYKEIVKKYQKLRKKFLK